MKTRIVTILALLTLTSLAFTPMVRAESADEEKVIEGKGTLYAKGVGSAHLQGDGRITIQGHGLGSVWIKGAESLHAEGHGERREVHGGILYVGWQGEINAAGANLDVRMRGGIIEFTASGNGKAALKGRGVYRIGHVEGYWLNEGVIVHFHPAP